MLKAFVAMLVLGFSINGFALTDDEYIELSSALGDGNMKVVKKYVTANPAVVNEKFFAWTPIQMAAEKGQFELVKYLAEHGADKNYAHPISKMTAFHLAAFNGFENIVKYLAAQGADVNIKMKGGVSIIRVVKDEGNTKMVDLLTSLGVKEEGCEEECF